ncbi:hypothetical protein CRG98_037917 [Punica granatum]|uniref:Uncharacterized protein n=1 Tax=Punica granatum TaxID=22663 RepID=A0A2I0ICL2_PUNGR|nr:hypothetical protein CRG98_037917 [Punica granatum]
MAKVQTALHGAEHSCRGHFRENPNGSSWQFSGKPGGRSDECEVGEEVLVEWLRRGRRRGGSGGGGRDRSMGWG